MTDKPRPMWPFPPFPRAALTPPAPTPKKRSRAKPQPPVAKPRRRNNTTDDGLF